jgi:hypothetical protein
VIAFLLGRPALLASIIGAASIGGIALYHVKVVDGSRERYIVRLEAENSSQAATIANQQLSISAERQNTTILSAAIDARNHLIAEQALTLQAKQLSAALAVKEAVAKGRAEVQALASPSSPVTSDAPSMNAWIAETFGGAK